MYILSFQSKFEAIPTRAGSSPLVALGGIDFSNALKNKGNFHN